MWILCQCGNKRKAQPWKANGEVWVKKCLVCSPGPFNNNVPVKYNQVSTRERMIAVRSELRSRRNS